MPCTCPIHGLTVLHRLSTRTHLLNEVNVYEGEGLSVRKKHSMLKLGYYITCFFFYLYRYEDVGLMKERERRHGTRRDERGEIKTAGVSRAPLANNAARAQLDHDPD